MGYTHYWEGSASVPTDEQWNRIIARTKKEIGRSFRGLLCFDCDRPNSKPEFSDRQIWFNGRGENGHETFCLSRFEEGFNFCKTARKPYDDAVVATLKIVKQEAPNWLSLSSDGGVEIFS